MVASRPSPAWMFCGAVFCLMSSGCGSAPAPHSPPPLEDFIDSLEVVQIDPAWDGTIWTCPAGSGGYLLMSYKIENEPPETLEGRDVVKPEKWLLSWTFHNEDGSYVPLEGAYGDKFWAAGSQGLERSRDISDRPVPIRIWQAPKAPETPPGRVAFWSRLRMPETPGAYKCVIKLYPTTFPSASSIRDYGPGIVIKEFPVNVIASTDPISRAVSFETAGPNGYLPVESDMFR